MKRLLIPLFFFLLAAGTAFAQETTLTLPTNDNTSAFNVMKNNGTSVFKVDGNGMITGDGSELANVKSLTANASGDMQMEITSYDRYNPTLVRQVSITAPAQGVIIVIVSGYWQ